MAGDPLDSSEIAFRALCLGVAAMVVAPLVAFLIALEAMTAFGACEIQVFCTLDASEFAMGLALPALASGAALSAYLDRRKPPTRP